MAKKPNGNGATEAAPPDETAQPPAEVSGDPGQLPEAADTGATEQPDAGSSQPAPEGQPSEGAEGDPGAPPPPPPAALGPVTFTLGAGERTLNGRRRFPATVIARHPDGTVDLRVDYGQPQGTGTRRKVRQGDEAGCWS